MSTAMLGLPMADEKPKTMSIKLPMDVLESARIVSAFRGGTMTDLLAEILRPAGQAGTRRDGEAQSGNCETPQSWAEVSTGINISAPSIE